MILSILIQLNTNYKMKHFYNQINSKNIVLFFLFLIYSTNISAQVLQDGIYRIFSEVNTETITTDVTAPFEAFMTPVDDQDPFQFWTFTHQGDDVYIIENNGSNTTLGINDGWCGQFGDVRAGFANTDANVEFKVSVADAPDSFVIEIAFTECNFGSVNDPIKAFDIENGAPGGQLQTFDVDITNPNQQFRIVEPNSLSVNDINNSVFDIFYNQNQRTISINGNNIINNVKVYDVKGQVVQTIISDLSSNTAQLQFKGSANGLYFIQIENDNNLITKKVLIY